MFKAGFSRVDITPPLGTPLAGYFDLRPAKGILDPIQLNCLAVNDGEKTLILIASDFLSIMEVIATQIRKKISAGTGVPEDNIMITALHQHTSGRIGCWPWTDNVSDDEEYMSILYRKYVDVAAMAIDDMKEATVSTAAKETAEPISFIRRYKMKDGSTDTNPGRLNPNIDHPIGEADNTVRMIRFSRKEGKDIAFINFSTHPDVIGGLYFSADWPGFVRRFVEKDMDVHCMVANGAQGDTNHVNTGIAEVQRGYTWSEHMGRVIADTAEQIWDKVTEHKDTQLFSEVRLVYTPTNMNGYDRIEECIKLNDDYYSGKLDGPNKPNATVMGEVRRIKNLRMEKIFQRIAVTVMAIGDIALVGYGGEPFTDYATKSRAFAPEMFVITCGLANGQEGYLPTKEAFDEGGYEARSSRFTTQMPDQLQGAAKEMLDKCNKYKK